MSLSIGESAPDFTLPDQDGTNISLSSFKGKRVVVYFYPKDSTPGCTKEACNFRDYWDKFQANNISILGISKDPSSSHLKFINKYNLPFPLLTDLEPCPIATLYESYGLKKFMGREYMGMKRHIYVIDKNGNIEFIYLKVKVDTISQLILSDLKLI